MMHHWAKATCGMMGRSPDFMNVNMMAMAAAGDYPALGAIMKPSSASMFASSLPLS